MIKIILGIIIGVTISTTAGLFAQTGQEEPPKEEPIEKECIMYKRIMPEASIFNPESRIYIPNLKKIIK